MRRNGLWRRPLAWLEPKAPRLHSFLVTNERPQVIYREVLGGLLVILLLVTVLWGATGQPLNRSPVVVVESESMMRCDQGLHMEIRPHACDGPFGRLGSIDAGDLIFMRDVDSRRDVQTQVACLEEGGRKHYGACGDTITYRPFGSKAAVPVIHRAIFWLEVEADGTYSVPGCAISHANAAQVQSHPCIRNALPLGARGFLDALEGDHRFRSAGTAASGFITLGDNNPNVDQPQLTLPVRPDWILGKARGELPWIGLIKLWVSDAANGCGRGGPECNYADAPSDVKVMMWISLAVLVAGPVVVEKSIKRLRAREPPEYE